jgi:hypothetical protein
MVGYALMPERPDHEQDSGPEAARRRTRRWLAATLLSTFALAVAGGAVGFTAGSRHHRPGHHHLPLGALIAVVAAVAVLLAALGLILWHLLNRPAYRRVMQYPWRRRMRVAKALRRGEPVDPEDVPVADAVVGLMRKERAIIWFQPVLIASWILMACTRSGAGRWLYIGLAAVNGPVWGYAVRVQRRTIRDWEATSHPAAGSPPDTG